MVGAWELSLRAEVFSDFDLNATSHGPVNADYLGGLYSSFPVGGWSAVGRLFHQSGPSSRARTRPSSSCKHRRGPNAGLEHAGPTTKGGSCTRRRPTTPASTAVIIGQGNVAADVARILAKTVDELKHTDIAGHALEALAESRVREIHVIGRRGPAQAKFTNRELREAGEIDDCDAVAEARDLDLNPESLEEIADKNNVVSAKNVEIFRSFTASPSGKARRLVYHFLKSPVRLLGEGRLERLVLERNRLQGPAFKQAARGTGETEELSCGILFRSIGYKGLPMAGVPFDERSGVMPNRSGLVPGRQRVRRPPGLLRRLDYERGPTGIIGTNRACSVDTVGSHLAQSDPNLDATPRASTDALYPLLETRGVRVLSYPEWLKLDTAEVERGKPKGKPREKFTRIEEMLAVLG